MAKVRWVTDEGESTDGESEGNNSTSKFFEPYIQSGNINFLIGSGASSPAIPTAGNIEAEIDTLWDNGDEEAASRKCLQFVEDIDAIHSQLIDTPDSGSVHQVLKSYVEFLQIIDRLLFERKNILLPRQATVFTTNYDMFLEHASSLVPSIILNDGFERSSMLNSDFMFAPELYFDRTYRSGPVYGQQTEIPTINFVKLHGSLSWRRKMDSIVFDPSPVPRLTEEQKANINEVKGYLSKHFLILPDLRKHHTTLMERVYYDLLRLFSKAMDRENAVLIAFGFSFADKHILHLTKLALRNPTSQLIVVSYNYESAGEYLDKFSKQRNVTVLAPAAGATINFNTFNRILASVLPEVDND